MQIFARNLHKARSNKAKLCKKACKSLPVCNAYKSLPVDANQRFAYDGKDLYALHTNKDLQEDLYLKKVMQNFTHKA